MLEAGTSTSALCFGGEGTLLSQLKHEEWNGSNWTEVNDLNNARRLAGSGTSTEAV